MRKHTFEQQSISWYHDLNLPWLIRFELNKNSVFKQTGYNYLHITKLPLITGFLQQTTNLSKEFFKAIILFCPTSMPHAIFHRYKREARSVAKCTRSQWFTLFFPDLLFASSLLSSYKSTHTHKRSDRLNSFLSDIPSRLREIIALMFGSLSCLHW